MLDFIIVVLIAYCVLSGKRKGFVRVVLELGSFILAYIVAYRFGPYVGQLLDSAFNLTERLQDVVNVPLIDLTDEISRLINVIGYIVIFFVARFFVGFVVAKTSLINHIPLIGSANKGIGALAGLLKGYLFALLLVWLISFVAVEWAESLINGSFLAPILLNSFPALYNKLNLILSN